MSDEKSHNFNIPLFHHSTKKWRYYSLIIANIISGNHKNLRSITVHHTTNYNPAFRNCPFVPEPGTRPMEQAYLYLWSR